MKATRANTRINPSNTRTVRKISRPHLLRATGAATVCVAIVQILSEQAEGHNRAVSFPPCLARLVATTYWGESDPQFCRSNTSTCSGDVEYLDIKVFPSAETSYCIVPMSLLSFLAIISSRRGLTHLAVCRTPRLRVPGCSLPSV